MVIAWLWKKINCSIKGEDAFWKPRAAQVAISNKIKIYIWILSSLHYSATLELVN